MDNVTRLDQHENRLKPYIVFSAVFVLTAVLVYLIFLAEGRTLIRFHLLNKDSFSQRYIFIFEFRHFLERLFSGGTVNTWDWSIGLGADALSFNIANLFNPFSYITAFTPDKYVDVVYSLTIVMRIYLSGITFILFARKLGIDSTRSVVGALIYAFSPWVMVASVTQGHFLMATVMLPLVMLGEEKVMKGESPLIFILSVAYTLITSFSFAYIIAIITFLYFAVRYLTYYKRVENRPFLKCFGMFMGAGVIGVMISGISLLITFMRLSHSTSESSRAIVNIYSLTRYLRFPLHLMDFVEIFGSNSVISVSALSIVMIPLAFYSCYKLKTNAIMTALLLIFTEIPVMNRLFNFMSYESGRWMFSISFFAALATVECLDMELLGKKQVKIATAVYIAIYAAYILWISKVLTVDRKIVVFTGIACCILIVAAIFIFTEIKELKPDVALKRLCITASVITLAGLAVSYNAVFSTEIKGFLKAGEADELIHSSPQRVGAMIDDKDFWRIDQIDESSGARNPRCKVNEAMYYENRSNYVFYSSVDTGWLEYNKLLGNNSGYYKRVAPNSNDQRFGLDFLQGTKYFIGNSKGIDDANDYAGFGFEPYKTIDGVEVLKNKYDIGIGCMFTKYMYRSEWLKLSYPERELAMLNAVVVPNGQKMSSDMEEVKVGDLEFNIREIKYDMYDKKNKGSRFKLAIDTKPDEQVMLSFKNIRNTEDDKMKAVFYYSTVHKTAVKTENDERGFSDIDDITINFGHGAKETSVIKVILKRIPDDIPGVRMKYDDLKVYGIPNKDYAEAAEALVPGRLNIETFENDYIKGKVHAEKGGMLYLSILDNNGWDIYVDGEKQKKCENVDIAFSGVELTSGDHTVELKYHTRGFIPGICLSIAGLVLMIILCNIVSRSRKETA